MAIDVKLLNEIRSRERLDYSHTVENAIYEYCARQRMGKTTLMVADLANKLLSPDYDYGYIPDEVHCNFSLFIPGVHCWTNEQMLEILMKAKKERWRHKVYLVDECSQPPLFYARNTSDKTQTELVTSLWQMPKLGCNMLYTSNIGNSVDVQQRDATWYTIMPYKYHHDLTDRRNEYIIYRVIACYDMWCGDWRYNYPAETQKLFDSFKPII